MKIFSAVCTSREAIKWCKKRCSTLSIRSDTIISLSWGPKPIIPGSVFRNHFHLFRVLVSVFSDFSVVFFESSVHTLWIMSCVFFQSEWHFLKKFLAHFPKVLGAFQKKWMSHYKKVLGALLQCSWRIYKKLVVHF